MFTTNSLKLENGINNQDSSSLLSDDDMPKDVRGEIYRYLSPRDLCLFAQTSKKAELETAFLRLLDTALYAEPESYKQTDKTKLAAIAILKRHPELLFEEKGTVIDHVGRKIKASPYRIFLGTGDTWALKQLHAEIIPNIKNGAAQAEIQFKAQFPNCQFPFDPEMGEKVLCDDRNREQLKQVKTQLEIIVQKITVDLCTHGQATLEETTKAVAELCNIFAPKKNEIIQTGLHFPLAIMQEIYKVYDAQFNLWSGAQLYFFSRAVIGAAAAASAAVDGQCYKHGLNNMDMNKGPDRRDGLFCRHPKGIPENLTPIRDKLGQTMFVDPYDGASCFMSSSKVGSFVWYNTIGGAVAGGWVQWRVCVAVGNLWRTKAEDYGRLCSHAKRNQSQHLNDHERPKICVIV